MKTITIKNRFTSAVLYTAEVADDDPQPICTALEQAVKADANLTDAYLAGANLARANLARANLADASLARADLADADLARAYLAGANLAGADLADANLAGADLAGADLARAYLAGANLAGADLAGAYNVPPATERTDPTEPYQRAVTAEQAAERAARRMAKFRERHPEVPIVDQLDRKIFALISNGVGKLDMSQWHTCETTHCRAGWAITLAGKAGKTLEQEHGPHRAGVMIYRASTGRVPHFFATDAQAMEDIKRCAGETK